MSRDCPVCNKGGLPDYTKIDVVCSQCNSDLKAFRILNTIASDDKRGIYKSLYIYCRLLFLFLQYYFSIQTIKSKILYQKTEKLTETVRSQAAFIEGLKNAPTPIVDNSNHVIVNYTVMRGDNLYKISRFFYGDGNKYHQIMRDNNLEAPYILDIEQMLKIRIDIR